MELQHGRRTSLVGHVGRQLLDKEPGGPGEKGGGKKEGGGRREEMEGMDGGDRKFP